MIKPSLPFLPTFLTYLTDLTYLTYLAYLTYLTYLTYLPYLPNLFKTPGTEQEGPDWYLFYSMYRKVSTGVEEKLNVPNYDWYIFMKVH
jgi:hypothetical protein